MRARMQPDVPRGVLDARPRGRASMQPDGRYGHARRHTHTTMRHSFAPSSGNDITLQDHVVVDSKILNSRLHVLSCDVSCGADLVSQLLHSLFVGAVEVFSVGQQIRPVRALERSARSDPIPDSCEMCQTPCFWTLCKVI
jgi:hypothetical protein